jgi:diaminohydroxyphosphoribosylaminopyrimidine deaminase/5-amino-6-(5-phosphoribosylamino)uracil reductase
MQAARDEAARGVGRTHPNPAVGAVIVKARRILARGWHRAAGGPHAEIEALRALKNPTAARGATIYITLEPCSTHGRTPPCTDAIIAAGIARVVYGARDPNPLHAGRADRILKKAGIRVSRGVLSNECESLNEGWNKWIATGLPLVIAKAGMTLDGRLASPPGQRWITSEAARQDAMRLRAGCGAILVGGETVRVDNPKLTIRGIPGVPQPWRVVWSRSGKLPSGCHLLTDAHRKRTLVFKGLPLQEVLKALGDRGVEKVLIEGGGRTLGEAFDRDLVDRIVFYIAPLLTGGAVPAIGGTGVGSNADARRLTEVTYETVGPDLKVSARVLLAH